MPWRPVLGSSLQSALLASLREQLRFDVDHITLLGEQQAMTGPKAAEPGVPDRRPRLSSTLRRDHDELPGVTRLGDDDIQRLYTGLPVWLRLLRYYSALLERAPMVRNHSITFSCRVPRPSAASSAVPSA